MLKPSLKMPDLSPIASCSHAIMGSGRGSTLRDLTRAGPQGHRCGFPKRVTVGHQFIRPLQAETLEKRCICHGESLMYCTLLPGRQRGKCGNHNQNLYRVVCDRLYKHTIPFCPFFSALAPCAPSCSGILDQIPLAPAVARRRPTKMLHALAPKIPAPCHGHFHSAAEMHGSVLQQRRHAGWNRKTVSSNSANDIKLASSVVMFTASSQEARDLV